MYEMKLDLIVVSFSFVVFFAVKIRLKCKLQQDRLQAQVNCFAYAPVYVEVCIQV